jgi:hypothetical protein
MVFRTELGSLSADRRRVGRHPFPNAMDDVADASAQPRRQINDRGRASLNRRPSTTRTQIAQVFRQFQEGMPLRAS